MIECRGFCPLLRGINGSDKVFVDGKWIRGKWVYGFFYFHYDGQEHIPAIQVIKFPRGIFGKMNSFVYKVIPETVGMKSEEKDVNGKGVYEGDILEWTDDEGEKHYMQVVREKDALLIKEQNIVEEELLYTFRGFNYKVVGNIYSRPELIKNT